MSFKEDARKEIIFTLYLEKYIIVEKMLNRVEIHVIYVKKIMDIWGYT